MKKKMTLMYILIGLIFMVACNSDNLPMEGDTEIAELEKQIEVHEEKIKQLEEENMEYISRNRISYEETDSYIKSIQGILEQLDEETIFEIAKNEWDYSIEIDGKLISDDTAIEVNRDNFQIIYSQEQSGVSTVIEELSDKGIISGQYQDHLTIEGIEPQNITTTDGTVVTAFIFEFEDLPNNTDFSLELTDELRDRLDINTNVINVSINY